MLGTIALAATLFFALCAALVYGVRLEGSERYGRILAGLSFLTALMASAYLMALILGNRFDVAYVASYSSTDLPLMYKISAFWAGQQGSFLLWLFIHAAAALLLVTKHRMEQRGLMVYMLLEALLTILVLAKSPFVPAEAVVQNGVGLNPLLQDPWMAVHPPIIFLGYALFAVPFSYCMGSLLDGAFTGPWLERARKWALVSWAFLGAGIFIGGYWAYKVLGWGGYWGWDPVENSSLVPWLLAGVFLHILHVARRRQAALSVMHLAVIFAFSLVIYGTFLTRSGILGDFSVHSFSGTSIGMTLAIVNALVLVGALVLLAVKAGRLPQGSMYPAHDSREFLLLLGSLILVFLAAIIFLGMSMPLFTQLIGQPAAVDSAFYVRTTMPLAIAMCIVMTLSCLRGWQQQTGERPRLLLAVLAVIGLVCPLFVGVREVMPILLSAVAVIAFGTAFYSAHRGLLGAGGMIAHAGVSLALFAMVLAGSGSQSLTKELAPGDSVMLAGYTVTYEGQVFAEDGTAKHYRYLVDGEEVLALTKLHKNGEDAAREPAIAHTLTGDIYIAPTPPRTTGREELLLKKGRMAMDDRFAYRYENVTMENQPGGKMLVTAEISVTDGEKVEHVKPQILATLDGGTSEPIPIFGGEKRLRLTGISGNDDQARIEILPSAAEEASQPITASVSSKPYIYLLWLGALAVTAGCFLAVRR